MKRIIQVLTIFAFLVLLIGCDDKTTYIERIDFKTSVIEIDGCEYIRRPRQLSHKGNCKNKIHKYNK